MEILVHTDNHLTLRPDMDRHVRGVLESKLARFASRLTRVDVGFVDENVRNIGVPDLRCTIEARPSGRDPVVVHADAPDFVRSFDSAFAKLVSAMETRFGREGDVKGSESIRTSATT
jgi:hypothetical protein